MLAAHSDGQDRGRQLAWTPAPRRNEPFPHSPLTRLGAGGRFGLMRIEPAKPDGRVWQVSIEAGFDAIFDSQNRLDVVGWDGNYGLMVTTASSSPIALKIAVPHISAHVGDEYQERTGRPRINYTRDELSVGATGDGFRHARSGIGGSI